MCFLGMQPLHDYLVVDSRSPFLVAGESKSA